MTIEFEIDYDEPIKSYTLIKTGDSLKSPDKNKRIIMPYKSFGSLIGALMSEINNIDNLCRNINYLITLSELAIENLGQDRTDFLESIIRAKNLTSFYSYV